MKKITEETLNAIQENVRTRETQELGYKRDNLFKGSWKDFEIKDLKPNLIENGWDSFEPYGSGTNYVENWDFNNNIVSFVDYRVTSKIDNNQLKVVSIGGESAGIFKKDIPYTGDVVVRMKVKPPTGIIYGFTSGGSGEYVKVYPSEGYQIVEGNFKINDLSNQITIYANIDRLNSIKGDNFVMDWIQITPVDNQHLVVEKTALGNGLTRIQVWGGNDIRKLRVSDLPRDRNKIMSFFVKDNVFFSLYDYFSSGTRRSYEPNYNEVAFNKIGFSAPNNFIEARRATDSLDFIASDPQIVEGDVPNPTMIVTPLSDGRERVQVYGATKDTKLVYSGDEGFVGENYGLKTTIENNGIDLDLSTSLTEEKKRIEKGENKVNLQGELSTKLSVEIGVPSE